MAERPTDTRGGDYAASLSERSGARWKLLFDVQAPYRWNLRRLGLGFTLDVGCGIGRNLLHLSGGGVGVDHNAAAIAIARARGCDAYTTQEFASCAHARPEHFDSLLFSHVLEHMRLDEAAQLVGRYLGLLRPGGRVVLIAPQPAGFRSDPSHVAFLGFEELHAILAAHGLARLRSFSFPLPRFAGSVFRHNEFVVVGRKSAPD